MFDVDYQIESTEIREAVTDWDYVGDERIGSASISLFGPKCLRGVFVEDNQSTIRILESGKSPAFRHTDKTQRVNLAWLAEQFRRKHYQLVHAATVRQSADICAKPFTNSDKWKNALRLISHTDLNSDTSKNRGSSPRMDGRTGNLLPRHHAQLPDASLKCAVERTQSLVT